jgi:hypothetical protein
MTEKADHWLRSTRVNTESLTSSEFAIMINNRFAAETSLELIDSFKHAFEELMGKVRMRNPTLPGDYFVGYFISRLNEYIKIPLMFHAPSTLVQAYALARNHETTLHKRATTEGYKWNSKGASLAKSLQQEKPEKPDEKPRVATRWEKGKCFKC